ncbi:tyrosine-type recombinase/integrase [Candidatus Sumerlaeota bacterium]|nr:tyrosine-type recombinase/integrase [Candidatus Sumerlaeota bacterium]
MALAFHEILAQYEQFLRVEKNLSEKTRRAYLYDLTRFQEFLIHLFGKTPEIARVTPDSIREYLNHLQVERSYRSTTLSRTIASIRIFFEFCVMRGWIGASPAAHLHNPKQPKKLPIYLVQGELTKLLEAPDRNEHGGARDFTIMAVLAFTGTRLSEIVGLNVQDINLEQRSIRVMGKGRKERMIPLNEFVFKAVNEYLDVRGHADSPALFLNRFGDRLSGRSVENIIRKYALMAGVFKDRLSPHKLRHTFATLLHANDVDVLEIQALLGHSSITSTQIYTHTSSSRLRSAVGKLDAVAP